MTGPAYYNEIDPFAAAWLRELIKAGMIASGDVDERSIEDVRATDLAGYRQCHFFAGIGGWSYALRLAGWPDDCEVWTGSCPCQPFSAAGKRGGFDDARHLWPAWFRLIAECRPRVLYGEQVASKDGLAWLDAVSSDLEGADYACGAFDLCAAGVGAPHIRQRLYFVADSGKRASERDARAILTAQAGSRSSRVVDGDLPERHSDGGPTCLVADADGRDASAEGLQRSGQHGQQPEDGLACGMADAMPAGRAEGRAGSGCGQAASGSGACELDHTTGARRDGARQGAEGKARDQARLCGPECGCAVGELGDTCCAERGQTSEGRADDEHGTDTRWQEATSGQRMAGSFGGFWSDAVWLPCRDGKARPVEPCSVEMAARLPSGMGLVRLESHPDCPHEERIAFFPLIQKGKARVGRLRGYGNAICAPLAAEVVRAYMEATE